jgi:type I restriction enzyme S subunit
MVPEGWENHQLAEVCELINGRGFKPHEWDTEGYPIIRIQNLNGSNQFNYYNGDFNPKILVRNGELLFAWSGSRGTSFGPHIWNGSDAVLNYHTWRVVPKEKTSRDFLVQYLRHITTKIEATAHGASALVHTQKQSMEKRRCILPPLPEQRKIADIISTWDQAIEQTEALLSNARTQKRALMQQLLTGKRRFPAFEGQPWKEVRLGDVADVDEKSLGSKTPDDFEFDYISLSNVVPGRVIGKLDRLVYGDAPSRAKRIVQTGDLLVSTVRPNLMGFARVSAAHSSCIASTGFAVVTPKKTATGSYLFHYLFSHHMKSQVHGLVVGSNYPAINSSDVKKLKINLPPLDEQKLIGEVLDNCDVQCDYLTDNLSKLRNEKKALMQQLLTGKRRVMVHA